LTKIASTAHAMGIEERRIAIAEELGGELIMLNLRPSGGAIGNAQPDPERGALSVSPSAACR
jgi:hypothetical protein